MKLKEGKIYKGTFAYLTDVGKVRLTNEDQAKVVANAYGDILLVVCDGLGGHNQGAYASKLAVDMLTESFLAHHKFFLPFQAKAFLLRSIEKINKAIYQEATTNPHYKDMATTIVACLIHANHLYIANIGDSRCYIFRDGHLYALTDDQSYVNYLVKSGRISKEESKNHPRKNVLTNALGIYPSTSLELKRTPYAGETILLCSDGFYNQVRKEETVAILETDDSVSAKCESFISIANANGGSDNIAVALFEAKL